MNYLIQNRAPWILKTPREADNQSVFGEFRDAKRAMVDYLESAVFQTRQSIRMVRSLREKDLVIAQDNTPAQTDDAGEPVPDNESPEVPE